MFLTSIFFEPKKALTTSINAIIIICISLFAYYFANKEYQPTTLYDKAQLVFATQEKDEQKKYAVPDGKGKFLFAAGAPRSVGSALFFHSTGRIRIGIESEYLSKQCSEKGIGKTKIYISTPVEKHSQVLGDSLGEIVLPILAGDKIRIRLVNHAEAGCGRAKIRLSEDTQFFRYILAFPLIWFSVLVLLTPFNLGALAVWGAGIQASYVLSETLYGQAIHSYMGLTTLLALFGVGLALITLFARPLKPVAFVLFILTSIILLGLPLLNIGNFSEFSSPIDSNSIHAIWQTNVSELTQFLGDNFPILKLLLLGLSVLTMSIFAILVLRVAHTALTISGIGLLFLTLSMGFFSQFSNNIVTLKVWKNSTFSYFRELSAFSKLSDQRKKLSWSHELKKVGVPRTTVLVIGESHNKNHMSLYGYPRPTTPALEKRANNDGLIVFQNVYSNHTHTTPTLSLALTQANQYNSLNWFQSPSIIELAKQANIQTYWLSNQQMLGAWDNQVSLIAQEADQVVAINKKIGIYKQPEKFDEALFAPLQNSLEEPGEKLIVLHLMGNHGSYCMRYSKDWEIYSQTLETSRFGHLSQNTNTKDINCYDNSIAYNDYVLDSIFSLLEKSAISASVFYFADHSEEIFAGKAHNQANFEFAMAEIPSLVWATVQWKKENSTLWNQLIQNRNQLFTNDMVFDTVLGLMGLEGKLHNLTNDLSNAAYHEPTTPVTLHGRKKIYSPENRSLWQKINGKTISENGQSGRLLPHRVNTIGKMRDTVSAGINSFEIDIYYTATDSETFFEVGHDRETMSGMRLEEFLAEIPGSFKKIWLDVKNVRPGNVGGIVNKLDELDSKYDIKNRIIVESSDRTPAPKLLVDEGYHVSYYLPTTKVLSVTKENEKSQRNLAIELAEIVQRQNSSAVSFDLQLYEFVKTYLEPLLKADIQYHTWFPGVNYGDSTLLGKLGDRPYFSDERVKTILLPYSSLYSL